jgi:hypothetical protein
VILYLGDWILLGQQSLCHLVFSLLWSSKCQPKHRVFFWLLLQDKLNTRDRLQQRHMALESYVYENCILQRRETVYHLFLRCSFARNYWNSIGVVAPIISYPQRAVLRLKRQIHNQCAMEIVILMAWCIWKCRNGWIFDNIPPSVERCRFLLKQELNYIQYRLKPDLSSSQSIMDAFSAFVILFYFSCCNCTLFSLLSIKSQ